MISHKLVRLILRIIHCIGVFFGSLIFIYEVFIQHNVLNSIFYAFYLIVNGLILYILFARKRPKKQIAYGAFCAMICIIVLFIFIDIYESITIVSKITKEMINHIEDDKEINPSVKVIIEFSKLVLKYIFLSYGNFSKFSTDVVR